jgi:hypothetical protein
MRLQVERQRGQILDGVRSAVPLANSHRTKGIDTRRGTIDPHAFESADRHCDFRHRTLHNFAGADTIDIHNDLGI